MAISSKDIFLLILGTLFSVGAGVLWSVGYFNSSTLFITSILFILIGILIFFQMKLNEFSETLNFHETELKKYEEKFKIYERLNRLELEVFDGKKRSC